MALKGDNRFLLGDHPERITHNTGFQQPRSIGDMEMQLGLLLVAVDNFFRNECPSLSIEDLENRTNKISIAVVFNRAAELVKTHGSLIKLRELENQENSELERRAITEAMKYLNQEGQGSENISNLREAIQREQSAQSGIIEGTAREVLILVNPTKK